MKKLKKQEECIYCHGLITTKQVQKVCTWGGRLIAVVNNVPAGVCNQCGERYYTSRVLKKIDTLLEHRRRFAMRISVPITEYAA